MPVEKPDVIDFITTDPKTNAVALVMVETRDWNATPGSVEQLHAKIEAYAQFILSGSLARQNPKLANSPVCIRLEHFTPIPPEVAEALRQWAGRLSGIPVGVFSHRMHWSRLITWFHRLVEKLTEPNRYLVRWPAEPGAALPLMNAKQFTDEFVVALKRRLPRYEVQVVQDLQLKLIAPDGKDTEGFLDNAYNHYRIAPDRKAELIEKYLKAVLETLQRVDAPFNKDCIVPVVKDTRWLQDVNEGLKSMGKEKTMESVHEVYNEELVIAYAEDSRSNIRYLTPANLAALSLGPGELRKLACANLERLLPVPNIQMEAGIYQIRAGGDYEASLLVVDDFWESSKFEVRGEIVAAIPARDVLLVTGSQDTEGLRRVKSMAEAVFARVPYRLSPKLFVRRGGTFIPFEEQPL